MSITATGLSPQNVCVQPAGQVTFTNTDTKSHHLEFDNTSSCPAVRELNASGDSVTVAFPTAVNCTFHDGNAPTDAKYRGTVAVTQVTVGGGGY